MNGLTGRGQAAYRLPPRRLDRVSQPWRVPESGSRKRRERGENGTEERMARDPGYSLTLAITARKQSEAALLHVQVVGVVRRCCTPP
jgi:hypothetical protein